MIHREQNNGVGNNADEYLTSREITDQQREEVQRWISEHISPRKSENSRITSYGLKHKFDNREEHKGFYMTNGEFKGAMRASGYEPTNPDDMNWCYRINFVEIVRNYPEIQNYDESNAPTHNKKQWGDPCYIYGLRDPNDGMFRYIGQTFNPKKRYMQHIHIPKYGMRVIKNPVLSCWIQSISPKFPEMVILERIDFLSARDLMKLKFERERFYTEKYESEGHRLLNINLTRHEQGWKRDELEKYISRTKGQ